MKSVTTETKATRVWWTLTVSGYGSFAYYGTADEASEMLRHKSAWEGGTGRMRAATPYEIAKGVETLRFRKEQGYGMDARELEAIA
jgi:hypothetical protein